MLYPAIFLKKGTAYEASWPEIRACRIEIAEHLLKKSLFLFKIYSCCLLYAPG